MNLVKYLRISLSDLGIRFIIITDVCTFKTVFGDTTAFNTKENILISKKIT